MGQVQHSTSTSTSTDAIQYKFKYRYANLNSTKILNSKTITKNKRNQLFNKNAETCAHCT